MSERHPMYPALSLLERKVPPLKYGREPFWRPPVTPASHDCHIPTWNWHSPLGAPDDAELLTLDTNAAYLSAAGGVRVAHSQLARQGGMRNPAPRDVLPGYYRVSVPYWAFSATIVSPLGDSPLLQSAREVWVAAPTLILLLELLEEGSISDLVILDAWTAKVTTDFRAWVRRLKSVREEILGAIDRAATDVAEASAREQYDAFKEGYSVAWSMMLTGEKCLAHRPDWSHTVYAQHAASQWRKAWRYTFTGHPLVSMGNTDAITILADGLAEALQRPKPPFRYDPTGLQPGALKLKPKTADTPPAAPESRRPLALVDDLDLEDIL